MNLTPGGVIDMLAREHGWKVRFAWGDSAILYPVKPGALEHRSMSNLLTLAGFPSSGPAPRRHVGNGVIVEGIHINLNP